MHRKHAWNQAELAQASIIKLCTYLSLPTTPRWIRTLNNLPTSNMCKHLNEENDATGVVTASDSVNSSDLAATANPQEILGTGNLDEQELELLKKQDFFLYNSIPVVWKANVIHNRDPTIQDIQGSGSQRLTSRRSSATGRMQSEESTKVERKTRLSYECPMEVIMEDLMGDLDDLIVDGEKFTFEHLLKLELADI